LHEIGMITSSPKAILAEGTDWRFLIHAAPDCATFFGARIRDRTLGRSVW
jgi:hypothetical protein